MLFELGPRINDLFNDPEVGRLIDPAVVILGDDGPPDIHVIERLEVTALMPDDSLSDRNADPPPFPVVVVVAFKNAPSVLYRMPDPRVLSDWYKPGFFD